MNREHAEAFLLQLAEAELRRATTGTADPRLLDECYSVRFEVTAQALHTVRAYDMAAADEIHADLVLALGVRQAGQGGGLPPNAEAQLRRLSHEPPGPGRAAAGLRHRGCRRRGHQAIGRGRGPAAAQLERPSVSNRSISSMVVALAVWWIPCRPASRAAVMFGS
jgi:hypothetical protein